MALGSVVALLAVALTATSFTWREHVTIERSTGKELTGLSSRDYPGARALLNKAKVPKLPMRPTVLEARKDLPRTTEDGCISDFDNVGVVNCTYGDETATRTIALAGGSHAEHWITALDLLGRMHNFKVVTYLKMGCPLTTEEVPLVMGDNRPYPKCHEWNERVMDKIIADRPDYVFTTATRPWNIKPGDVMPANLPRHLADVVRQRHSDPRDARHPVAGAQRSAVLPRRLSGRRRQRHLLRSQAFRRTVAL